MSLGKVQHAPVPVYLMRELAAFNRKKDIDHVYVEPFLRKRGQ